jgi:hypothetical protein
MEKETFQAAQAAFSFFASLLVWRKHHCNDFFLFLFLFVAFLCAQRKAGNAYPYVKWAPDAGWVRMGDRVLVGVLCTVE